MHHSLQIVNFICKIYYAMIHSRCHRSYHVKINFITGRHIVMDLFIWTLSAGWLFVKITVACIILWKFLHNSETSVLQPPWLKDYFNLGKICENDGGLIALITFCEGLVIMCSIGIAIFFLVDAAEAIHHFAIPLIDRKTALIFSCSMLLACMIWCVLYHVSLLRNRIKE